MESGAANNLNVIEMKIQELFAKLHNINCEDVQIQTAKDAETLELSIQRVANELADWIAAKKMQRWLAMRELAVKIRGLVQNGSKQFINKGPRTVTIRFSGGSAIQLIASYWVARDASKKHDKGIFLSLLLLGIQDHCTPLLIAEIPKLCAALGSLKEAQDMLSSRGCQLDIKTILNIMKRFSKRARLCQKAQSHILFSGEKLAGRRVVVSTDGGRVRIRKNKRGPRTKKGRCRYSTFWREPKLMIIYVVNEEGRMSSEFSPVIDGSMSGPESIFALLLVYLQSLGIAKVDKILFVADGAVWIWEGVQALKMLLKTKGIVCEIIELIDMYHAVQHLYAFAELKKRQWSTKKRARWINAQKERLKRGKIDVLLIALRIACRGARQNKALTREYEYFSKNRERLAYHSMRALKMPLGSGAVESAIRRVVNLRLKSPCVFWNEDTAEEMLLLRAYYKAGRWDLLKTMACEGGLLDAA